MYLIYARGNTDACSLSTITVHLHSTFTCTTIPESIIISCLDIVNHLPCRPRRRFHSKTTDPLVRVFYVHNDITSATYMYVFITFYINDVICMDQ